MVLYDRLDIIFHHISDLTTRVCTQVHCLCASMGFKLAQWGYAWCSNIPTTPSRVISILLDALSAIISYFIIEVLYSQTLIRMQTLCHINEITYKTALGLFKMILNSLRNRTYILIVEKMKQTGTSSLRGYIDFFSLNYLTYVQYMVYYLKKRMFL